MKVIDIIKRSGRSLRSAKTRTILTSLAIAVGGFTLTMTLAAGNGIRAYTDRLVSSNFDPTELIVGRDSEISNTGKPNAQPKEYDDSVGSINMGSSGSMQLKQVTDEDIKQLKALPYAESVREFLQLPVQYVTTSSHKRYTASAEAYNSAQRPELLEGRLPASGSIATGTVILPESYVQLLGFKDSKDALGKKVELGVRQSTSNGAADFATILQQIREGTFKPSDLAKVETFSYTITGVSKKAATSMTFAGLPILVSEPDARKLYDFTSKGSGDYGKYMYAFLKVKDGNSLDARKAAQKDLSGKGYYTIGFEEIQKSITQIVNIFQAMVGVFGFITLLASVFGIINTQYISVLERTREIGLMKALGMRNKDIRRLFMFEAAWIGFLGGILGSMIAYIVGTLINPWASRKLFGDGNSLLVFSLPQTLLLILVLVLIAMAAGFFPARKAAKLDPIEALRTE